MSVLITFHGHLRDFASTSRQGAKFEYPLHRRASVKDVIEAIGPPHTEVGEIHRNGQPISFDVLLEEGGELDVYPIAAPWDVTKASRLRPVPLAKLAFLVDENVHRLAELLRMIGLDAADCRGMTDAAIAAESASSGRVLLSRDHRLLRRSSIVFGRLVRAHRPWEQLKEIVDLFGLTPRIQAFSRCIHCNIRLEPRAKADIADRLEPLTRRYYEQFHECPACRRIYWAGSHHQRMLADLKAHGISD
ncbi:Mut7-C RNAse domain-containing protein [Desulfonatronum parangueonense]